MENPTDFYQKEINLLQTKRNALVKQITNIRVLRFVIFLSACFGIYYTYKTTPIALTIGGIAFGIFIFLVLKFQHLEKEKKMVDAKLAINKTEIKVLNKDFYDLNEGEEFINPQHFFSNDIDLFGKGSFFQYINRTGTNHGKNVLANTLQSNDITDIAEKQEGLQELALKTKWRQHFLAIASIIKTKSSITSIVDWIQSYKTSLPKIVTYLPLVFSILSVSVIIAVSFGLLPFGVVVLWFVLGLLITGGFFKKVQNIYDNANMSKAVFNQYHQLLAIVESEKFTTSFLKTQQHKIETAGKKASAILQEFSKILDAFDQRNNIIIAVVGNAFFLWDIRNARNTEKWIATHKDTVKNWFDTVAFFDAQNSLANFVFNNPKFIFPKLNTTNFSIEGEQLGHPLLQETKRVDNDFNIAKEEFFIVTGANMAGKSTFLRTVSLGIVMANCGLPVCAKSFNYSPIKLITSMRTSDNLTEDESYFYSELKRLKFIVDEIKTERYFIILDEILKGTNSKDKATGSKKFVEKLTKSKSTGIIATHDVSLCELSNEYPQVQNYYFDALIENNELSFDYIMKQGVCKNMNASFLLQQMEII